MAATPPSADQASTQPNWHDDRIRRNVACVHCRNSKVRCKTSQVKGQPCQRCVKLQLSCVFDKSHKRVTKRSKLEQLEEDINTIKQAVAPRTSIIGSSGIVTITSPSLPQGPGHIASILNPSNVEHHQPSQQPQQLLTPYPATDGPDKTLISSHDPNTGPAQSRVVGDLTVSGEDIDWYFEKFLLHYHPFMPILRSKVQAPNECYEACPLLFWTVLLIACRRYAKAQNLFDVLTEHIGKEMWPVCTSLHQSMEAIHAVLLLCTWPLISVRLVSDSCMLLTQSAMNGCASLGLHTGQGSHPEFCFGPRSEMVASDEEAAATWVGACIATQRAAKTTGFPPPSIQLGDDKCRIVLSTPKWSETTVLLDLAKFMNKFGLAMAAQSQSLGYIPNAIVSTFEMELNNMWPILGSTETDIVQFALLTALQDIQIFYFFRSPDHPCPNLRLNTTKCFHTSRSLIALACDLEGRSKFLSHAPHWVLRTVMDASNIILAMLHSNYAPILVQTEADLLARQAYGALMQVSVRQGDLANRIAAINETFWNARHLMSKIETAPFAWRSRLGVGLGYWCYAYFKTGIQDAKKSTKDQNKNTNTSNGQPSGQTGATLTDGTSELISTIQAPPLSSDPFQDVDWTMFAEDFGWGGGDPVFMGIGMP